MGLEQGDFDLDAALRQGGGHAKIRCPACRWRPRARDRWMCSCGHTWNTFDTRGRCPACARQWRDTQCLACHAWSPHDDWYEDEEKPR